MRRRYLCTLLGLTALLALLPWNLAGGCQVTLPDGSGSGGTLFNLPPTVVASAIPDPPRGVAPLTIQFDSANSSDDGVIVERTWDFGDGQTSQDISPQHTFQSNGQYNVRLTLTDDRGASSSNTIQVVVSERPVAVINVDRDTAANAPAAFSFDGSASYDPDGLEGEKLTYRWDFGDGSREILPTIQHTYTAAGQYRVTLTVTDVNGIVGTADRRVEVGIPRPSITFRAPLSSLDALICSQKSPLWVQVAFEVEPDVPYMLRAGIDVDTDSTNTNDIHLDTNAGDGVLAADLQLTLPTALDLSSVPIDATYYMWVEIVTDRTTPTRTYLYDTRYSPARPVPLRMVGRYPSTIAEAPDILLNPTANDGASIVPEPTSTRQVIDLGPLSLGDRVYLSLLTVPGYGEAYTATSFSVLILDANQEMFAWYDNNRVLFSPASKLVAGHSSLHYYAVLDARTPEFVSGLNVRVQRQFSLDSQPRRQYVYLDFDGTQGNPISIANSALFELAPFSVDGLDAAVLAESIAGRVETLLAPYDFVVLSSARGDALPTVPYNVVYFDTSNKLLNAIRDPNGDGLSDEEDLMMYGLAQFVDPRNETQSGRAVVSVDQLRTDFPALTTELLLGPAIANCALHQLGLLAGLRETQTAAPAISVDIMTNDRTRASSTVLGFTTETLAPFPGSAQIGVQNAPRLLEELFRK